MGVFAKILYTLMGKSFSVTITKEFCRALNRFSRRFIKLPVNHHDTTRAIALFQDECKIAHTVGAIEEGLRMLTTLGCSGC